MNQTAWIALCATILLGGCAHRTGQGEIAPPVAAHCDDALCRAPCVAADGDTGVRWEADPADPLAFDALAEVVGNELADRLRGCEVRRRACEQCLDRLKAAGVIQ